MLSEKNFISQQMIDLFLNNLSGIEDVLKIRRTLINGEEQKFGFYMNYSG